MFNIVVSVASAVYLSLSDSAAKGLFLPMGMATRILQENITN